MRMRLGVKILAGIFLAFSFPMVSLADSTTFEDVNLPSQGYWNGSDQSGSIRSGDFVFLNEYNPHVNSWGGFSVSSKKDKTTSGPENQYSAVTGRGVSGSSNYAVAYQNVLMNTPRMELKNPATLSGLYVTNTTFAYLTMKNGSYANPKFGPGDWFRLVIRGFDAEGKETGAKEVYLADFRESTDVPFILDYWKWVDLGSLGEVKSLTFSLESSKGMSTPHFFAMDNVGEFVGEGANEHIDIDFEQYQCFISTLW